MLATDDKAYWERFYARNGASNVPSDFAEYVAGSEDPLGRNSLGHLFDVGCGNGRDTFFFADQGIVVTGIDQCDQTRNRTRAGVTGSSVDGFREADLTRFDYGKVADGFRAGPSYSVYARFVLHTLDPHSEERFFERLAAAEGLRYLFIECRTINDSLYGKGEKVGHHEFVTDHYRRFINPVELHTRLSSAFDSFDMVLFEESKEFDLAVEDPPTLLRAVLKLS